MLALKNIFRSQTSVLFIASMGGIFCGVIASILNTRFLAPDEYGNYRYVFNIITFLSSLLLFGYFVSGSRLLAISKDSLESKKINGAMLIILGVAVLVLCLSMIPLYYLHKIWLNQNVASLFLWAIPICGAPLIINYINTTFQGENRINELATARLLPYALYLPIGYMVYSKFGSSDVLLMLLQNGSAIIVYLILIILLNPCFKKLKTVFIKLQNENKSYGFHVYIGSILAVSLSYVSGITLGVFEDDNVNVGFYTLALTMASPLGMLPGIVGTTHFKEFATQAYIKPTVIKNTVIISLLSLLLFIIIIVPVVKFIYSPEYSIVGKYACLLGIGPIFHGFGDMYNRFLGAHGRGKEIRNGAVITGIIQVVGSIILVYFFGIIGAIITKLITDITYFLLMIKYYKIAKQEILSLD